MARASNGHSEAESPTLTSEDFYSFFRDVHSQDPFPWQMRLTAQVLEQRAWPNVIDLPTGVGKTSVLDTAVFALAVHPTISPRRIVFVIDRRIVVDQVYERAQLIRKKVESAETPILKQVRKRLRALSDGQSLGVSALRGGIPLDLDWALRPDQPWVVVSTVDQFGSRLLFRGYGVTPGMRPIHAGLTGNDCLVILDEVHLSIPFAESLAQVSALPYSDILPRRFVTVEMSATPSRESAECFTLDPLKDLSECAELRRRVTATKQASLVPVRNERAIPSSVLKIVKFKFRNESRIRSIGVVVNRVSTARDTHALLAREGYDAHLITGRMRPLDRIKALARIYPIVSPDQDREGEGITIVISTQAIEVGADFSFDALVTECAAIDSLRQRFGRLDRRGTCLDRTGSPAHAWIIGPKSVVNSKKPDPIYGDSTKVTWEELNRRTQRNGQLDVDTTALRDFPSDAIAPRSEAPLLLKSHMDAWVQTRPEPLVQPSVDWFLHGINQDRPPDVSVLWRFDRSLEALRLVPPRQAEMLQIPAAAAAAWLSGGEAIDFADVMETHEPPDVPSLSDQLHPQNWVRWNGIGNSTSEHIEVKRIHPGDVLVVDPVRGGLSAGTWDPSSTEPVEDLGDAAQSAYSNKVTLRLDPRLPYVISPPTPTDEIEADTTYSERIARWLEAQNRCSDERPEWINRTIQRLKNRFDTTTVGLVNEDSSKGYYILTERHRKTRKSVVDTSTMDDSDETSSFTASGIKLHDHLEGVGNRASRIAKRLGLPPEITEDLRLAGQLHDLGKVDIRFQLQLVGNDPVNLEMHRDEPLAKSLPGVYRARRYPVGMRHEVASVAMIESNTDVLSPAHDRDLVLHLVGTHHGWGRPLPPIPEDLEPQELSYTFGDHVLVSTSELSRSSLALQMADRFWRLVERYGYHGLAWLETILRRADHQQSAEEAK